MTPVGREWFTLVKSPTAMAAALWFILAAGPVPAAPGQVLTIRDVQYTVNSNGASDHDGEVIDCTGGIVVAKFAGYRPRLVLQVPNDPDGWGAIQAKDWIYPFDMFNTVQAGDWVEFTNMLVEEYVGTTFLQRQATYNPTFTVVSQGNPLPPPILISVSDVPAPVYDPVLQGWYVDNHDAEPYESMRIIVRDVTVTAMDLGKAVDNYRLENAQGEACWAADYMNEDAYPDVYHPFVSLGRHFCAVVGVFEQYTHLATRWDYYQLLPQTSADLAICGDGDADGDVELDDFSRFGECITGPACDHAPGGCNPPVWTSSPTSRPIQHCLMMDFDFDGDVDLADFGGWQSLYGAP